MKTFPLSALAAMLLVSSHLFTTGCKDDDDATPNKSKVLTDGAWQLTAMTSDPAIDWFGAPVTNVYAQLPACVKDDLTIFKENGSVNFDEGVSKCDPNDPQTTTGAWAFNTTQTILSVTQDGETESWEVSELEDDTFKADYKIVGESVTYTLSVAFDKK
jgi:hypothetical protein